MKTPPKVIRKRFYEKNKEKVLKKNSKWRKANKEYFNDHGKSARVESKSYGAKIFWNYFYSFVKPNIDEKNSDKKGR